MYGPFLTLELKWENMLFSHFVLFSMCSFLSGWNPTRVTRDVDWNHGAGWGHDKAGIVVRSVLLSS